MNEVIRERYINPYTDFGFKKLFGTELNKELLISHMFEQAEIAKFTPEERRDYEESVKIMRDLKNVVDTAEWKGRIREKHETAMRLKAAGIAVETIMLATGLTREEIENL